MRTTWLLLAFALILSGVACDTQQPTDAGTQQVTISVTGTGEAEIYNVWDLWIDVDGDCQVSDGDTDLGTECVAQGDTLSTTVPWRYSAVLTVIRAGTTTEELIATSVDTSNEFSSLSFYDDTVIVELGDQCDGFPGGVLRVNGKKMTAASREVMECLDKPNLLPANVLDSPGSYTVSVQQGDTVIFKARKARPGFTASKPYDSIALSPVDQFAEVFIDGRSVLPEGDAATGSGEYGGISISTRIR
jgi:hypothetical protein